MGEIMESISTLLSESSDIAKKAKAAGDISTHCRMGMNVGNQTLAVEAGVLTALFALCDPKNPEDVRRTAFKAIAAVTLNNFATSAKAAGEKEYAAQVAYAMSDEKGCGRLWNDCSASASYLGIVAKDMVIDWITVAMPAMASSFTHPQASERTINNVIAFLNGIANNAYSHKAFHTLLPNGSTPAKELIRIAMSENPQWSRYEAGLALAKIYGSQDDHQSFNYSQTLFIVSNTVALLDCVIDGTKMADSSFHPSLQPTSMALNGLCGSSQMHNPLYDNDIISTLSRAVLSSKARADIVKKSNNLEPGAATERVRSFTGAGVGAPAPGAGGADLKAAGNARGFLLHCIWQLSFIDEFKKQIQSNTKLVKQLSIWADISVDDLITSRTARALDESDRKTKEGAIGVLVQIGVIPEEIVAEERPEDQSRIYLSHCPEDEEFCSKLAELLKQKDFVVNSPKSRFSVDPKREWKKSDDPTDVNHIKSSLTNTELVVVCLSASYRLNAACHYELLKIFELGVPVLLISVQDGFKPEGWLREAIGKKLYMSVTPKNFEYKAEYMLSQINLLLPKPTE